MTAKRPPGRPPKLAELPQEALFEAAQIALAQDDLVDFVNYVLRDNYGNPVTAQPHQIAWADHIKYSIDIAKTPGILAPLGHAKTSWMAVALPLYFLGKNPNFRIMIVSSAEDIAAKRLQTIGRYIEDSAEYHKVFPWVVPDRKKWNQHNITVKREGEGGGFVGSIDPSISAYGYTAASAIGARADIIIFDDVADMKNSVVSAQARKTLHDLIFNTFMGRDDKTIKLVGGLKDREGHIISPRPIRLFIGTRYHEEDIYGHIMRNAQSYCTLIQRVSENFDCLDTEIIGAVESPVHPVYESFRYWQPDAHIA